MTTIFQEKVYAKLKKVPKGRITTYKELAKAIGTKAYRAVGQAMNKNPYMPTVPCHRVVCSNGRIGWFVTGTQNKIKLLESEGIIVMNEKIVDFEKKIYHF